jgi:hypothetical protein
MPNIPLGPYEEGLRGFLLGEPFPEHVAVTVTVWPSRNPLPTAYTPHGHRRRGVRHYVFYVPGIEFDLWVGRAIPAKIRNSCAVSGADQLLCTSAAVEPVTRHAFRVLGRTARGAPNVARTIAEVEAIRGEP